MNRNYFNVYGFKQLFKQKWLLDLFNSFSDNYVSDKVTVDPTDLRMLYSCYFICITHAVLLLLYLYYACYTPVTLFVNSSVWAHCFWMIVLKLRVPPNLNDTAHLFARCDECGWIYTRIYISRKNVLYMLFCLRIETHIPSFIFILIFCIVSVFSFSKLTLKNWGNIVKWHLCIQYN
jgi:hypothetical protein